MLCKIYSVKLVLHSTQWKFSYKSIHSLGNIFRGGKCFVDYADAVINSSIQQPRKLLPVIYCATYSEPALLVDGLVRYSITHFLKNIRKNQKPWKSTRALLIECRCQLNVKENKSSNKHLLWNNTFQITREPLRLICQFLTFNYFNP